MNKKSPQKKELNWKHSPNRSPGSERKRRSQSPIRAVPAAARPKVEARAERSEKVRSGRSVTPPEKNNRIPSALSKNLNSPAKRAAPSDTKYPSNEKQGPRFRRKSSEDDMKGIIEQLDKLADYNLNSIIGRSNNSSKPNVDEKVVKEYLGDTYQKKIDRFLHT